MKTRVFLSLLLLALSLPAHAQKPDKQARRTATTGSSNPVAALGEALQSLTLTDTQKTKLSGAAFKLEAEILGLLTPEQQAQFKEAQEKLQKARKIRTGNDGSGYFAGLRPRLKLTSEQSPQVEALLNQAELKIAELAESARGDKDARKTFLTKTQSLVEEVRLQLRPLLTLEQQAQLTAWQPQGKPRRK